MKVGLVVVVVVVVAVGWFPRPLLFFKIWGNRFWLFYTIDNCIPDFQKHNFKVRARFGHGSTNTHEDHLQLLEASQYLSRPPSQIRDCFSSPLTASSIRENHEKQDPGG